MSISEILPADGDLHRHLHEIPSLPSPLKPRAIKRHREIHAAVPEANAVPSSTLVHPSPVETSATPLPTSASRDSHCGTSPRAASLVLLRRPPRHFQHEPRPQTRISLRCAIPAGSHDTPAGPPSPAGSRKSMSMCSSLVSPAPLPSRSCVSAALKFILSQRRNDGSALLAVTRPSSASRSCLAASRYKASPRSRTPPPGTQSADFQADENAIL